MPVIPNGITHDFVILTNKKAQTAFSPFGFTVLVIPGGITHNFLRLTNEETSFFTVHRRRCGASGTRTRDPLLAKQMRYQLRHSPFRARKPVYRYFQTPGSLRKSFAAFSAQAIITPINSSFKIFFKSTYLVDC